MAPAPHPSGRSQPLTSWAPPPPSRAPPSPLPPVASHWVPPSGVPPLDLLLPSPSSALSPRPTPPSRSALPFFPLGVPSLLPALRSWPAGGAGQRRGGAGKGRDGTGGGADKGAGGAGLAEGAGRRQQRRRRRGVSQAGGTPASEAQSESEGRRRRTRFPKLRTVRRSPGAAGCRLRGWGPGVRARVRADVGWGSGARGAASPGSPAQVRVLGTPHREAPPLRKLRVSGSRSWPHELPWRAWEPLPSGNPARGSWQGPRRARSRLSAPRRCSEARDYSVSNFSRSWQVQAGVVRPEGPGFRDPFPPVSASPKSVADSTTPLPHGDSGLGPRDSSFPRQLGGALTSDPGP